ncbi:DNA-binding response regulator [Niabella ginsenosidivorans]|uniref:DNA-binding response regulator n=1 Tax=Niabella ginsenosidivorans TaxID=1176587 RepID=A0A1A9I251_9BACT|nr:LytTR family DNA-binding domain-containing protein [Niabella ginsenosidivorans]ANH81603.1 DNA-binding response regulator [Niabella ginsenosidivorans]
MIKAIAIDDEPLALDVISTFCKQCSGIALLEIFDNAVAGKTFAEKAQPDLVFVDINMPDINGLDLVNGLTYDPMIIFTTAYKEFALEGFELSAVDYLLKPFSFERFKKAIEKAEKYYRGIREKKEDSLLVYAEYRMIKILFSDILYIESLDDYIKIYLKDGRSVLTLLSLKKVLERLPEQEFARIHRGYIVSIKEAVSFLGRKLRISNGAELPVGETYLGALLKWIKPS